MPQTNRTAVETGFDMDVVIVGGCGHVGLPLGIVFAAHGLRVSLYDINQEAADVVNQGRLPFNEPGAEEVLERVAGKSLWATTDPSVISRSEHVIVVIGTPVDKHLNPDPQAVCQAVATLTPSLVDGQLLVLRSTVYPGVTAMVERLIERSGCNIDVAFCPERIAEGRALEELPSLPQLVAGRTDRAIERASKLFRRLTDGIVIVTPEEAELAKLFTNVWRYIKFAAANQFYMIANDFGVDFEKVRHALAYQYPRAADLPAAGFAAGPCLFKDTMQLNAFDENNFMLGYASMAVNEGLPQYVVSRMEKLHHLEFMTVGILGMAFKGGSDDTRSSLSYKLKRILRYKAETVLCTDPYVTTDPDLTPLEEVCRGSDLLIIGAPHKAYRDLEFEGPVIDIWNIRGEGVRI
jgi:UDP-N-acetyl-D-mannosaminuronic acid dehydrogenase